MSPLATVLPSPCCAGDWAVVNPGAVDRVSTSIVVACTTCGAEWHLRLDAVQLTHGRHGHNPTRRRRCSDIDPDDGDELAGAVLDVVTALHKGVSA